MASNFFNRRRVASLLLGLSLMGALVLRWFFAEAPLMAAHPVQGPWPVFPMEPPFF